MKKLLLLSGCLMLSYIYSQAQPVFYAESPASVQGIYAFDWADPALGWGTADLNDCANAVRDTLMLVDDGTPSDSLGCDILVNNLTGKIAVVYRFTCEFGVKAKNAQDAGAVGVIIINHSPGLINMAPGSQGANVTIPTVIISNTDGAKLRAQMDAGKDVVVFIGAKCYSNDLGFLAADVLIPRATANPAPLSASATEFNVPMGGWIHNYGTVAQTGVTLTAAISGAATYSASSSPITTLAPGDSVYATVPTYSAASYSGLYHINYSINYAAADSFPADNKFYANFLIDSMISYAFIDPVTQLPVSSDYYRPASQDVPYVTDYKTCIHFRDANASRLNGIPMGIYASASTDQRYGTVLDGLVLDTKLYEWNDVFTGLSDPAFPAPPWTLNEVGSGSYTYLSNLQTKLVYIPFSTSITLKDNQRYLFCVGNLGNSGTDTVQLGFDTYYNYLEVMDTTNGGHVGNDQPVSIVIADADQYAIGFGTDATASVSVKFGLNRLGVGEHNMSFDVIPYPNPTAGFIYIPLKGMNGAAQLSIMDMNGKVVNTQNVKVAGTMVVNVAGISNGNYVFSMLFENGKRASFNVVISK